MTNDIAEDLVVVEIDNYLKRLFPLCRSITGGANRETLKILQSLIPLQILEVPSGTKVYDWVVPKEWNIYDGYIADSKGERVIDFQKNNLHVVSYSLPINLELNWEELRPRLHFHPSLPNAVPYRTSYYEETWGFCVTQHEYHQLEKEGGPYKVVIKSTIADGSLTYGELLLPGESKQEVLLSCYICHPSHKNRIHKIISKFVFSPYLGNWAPPVTG